MNKNLRRTENWIRRTDPARITMITAETVMKATGETAQQARESLDLMSQPGGPLEAYAGFWENGELHVIEVDDYKEALAEGCAAHPETGEEIPLTALTPYWGTKPGYVWPDLPGSDPEIRKVEVMEKSRSYDGFFKIDRYDLRQSSGGRTFDLRREVFVRPPAAAILPYDPETDSVLIVEEFRIGNLAAGSASDESFAPGPIAGIVDGGETPVQAAIREAREEAGIEISETDVVSSVTILPSPGGANEVVTLILARASLRDVESGATFGEAGEGEMTWRRVISRQELAEIVRTQPCSGHLTSLSLSLDLTILSPGPERDRLLAATETGPCP